MRDDTGPHSESLSDPPEIDLPSPTASKDGSQFSTTQWSVVLAAGRGESADANAAMQKLCQAYWQPLYGYVRRRGSDLHDAHDLTQAFFARILEKNYFADADPTRGRFRSFLLTAFQHFLSNEWATRKSQRRGGGKPVLSLDFNQEDSSFAIEDVDCLTPEQIYERQWAMTLLNRVMQRLESEMGLAGKRLQFELLKDFIVGASDATYADTAAALGMTSSAARMAAARMRHRYRDLLREEIAQTVSSVDEVEDEIRHLFDALGT